MMMKIANMMKRLRKDEKGFTLIELMVVIAVLGIMAALIIPQFSNVNDKARLANVKSTANAVASAAGIAYAQYSNIPVTSGQITEYMSNYSDVATKYTVTIGDSSITVADKDVTSITSASNYR